MTKGFKIEADPNKKILRLKVWGFWTEEDAQRYREEFIEKSKPLITETWFVLADIAEYGVQTKEVQAVHGELMRYAIKNGMLKAANVISRLLNRIQIEKLSEASGIPMHSFFNSEDDAEKWLLD